MSGFLRHNPSISMAGWRTKSGLDMMSPLSTQMQSSHLRFARRVLFDPPGFIILETLERLNFGQDIAFDHDAAFQRLFTNTLAAATGQTHIFLLFYLAGDKRQPLGKGRST